MGDGGVESSAFQRSSDSVRIRATTLVLGRRVPGSAVAEGWNDVAPVPVQTALLLGTVVTLPITVQVRAVLNRCTVLRIEGLRLPQIHMWNRLC